MTNRAIEEAAGRFALLDHAPIGQLVLRQDFVVIFWNKCLEDWTGIDRSRIVGTDIREHFPYFATARYANRIAGIFEGGLPAIFSSQLHTYLIPAPLPGGRFRRQYTVVTALPDAESGSCHALFAIQDVTSLTDAIENHRRALKRVIEEVEERKKAQAELEDSSDELRRLNRILEERSIRDGLTGLYNHRHFYELLDRDFQLSSRNGSELSCILLDLDHFKEVNDAYGHPCGDAVLREVAEVIDRTVRKTDVLARYGGEEFALLLPDTDLAGARRTAENIRLVLQGHRFGWQEATLRITASIGLASRLAHSPHTSRELLQMADTALYQAKTSGRNRLRIYGTSPPEGRPSPTATCG